MIKLNVFYISHIFDFPILAICQGCASSRVLGRAGLVLAWGGNQGGGWGGAWGLGKATYSQASKGPLSGKARDSQASKTPLSGKAKTVRQAKDRGQASKGQSGKPRTVRQARDRCQAKQKTVRQAKDRCQAKQRTVRQAKTVPRPVRGPYFYDRSITFSQNHRFIL